MKLRTLLFLIPTVWVTLYCSGALVDIDLGEPVNTITTVMWAALGIAYIIHVWRNKSFVMTTAKRILWTLGLFLFGPIAMPIYFLLHVLPGESTAS